MRFFTPEKGGFTTGTWTSFLGAKDKRRRRRREVKNASLQRIFRFSTVLS
jgi:hypothetical protein